VLVLAVLLGLGIPYLLSILYVHRFKVPNAKTPADYAGRSFEDVTFPTDDGLTLCGWFIPAEEPSERSLVICHGLGANRSMFLPYLGVGQVLRANVLMFDFRGHGTSDGHTVAFGGLERLDVLAAIRYLRTERPEQAREVIGLGISMGAASLTLAAAEAEPPLKAVILDSGFARAAELTDSVLAAFPDAVRPWLTLPGIPLASLHAGCWLPGVRPVDRIGALRAPVLIIHAAGDLLIPPAHAQRLYERAAEPRSLWITSSGGHGAALFGAREEYLRAVRQLLPGQAAEPRRSEQRER
jgi:pimeloyl-ACP methyl ester carboxylesterase